MRRLRGSQTYAYLMGLLFGWLLGRGDYDWDAAPHGWGWLWAILPIVLLIVFWIYLRRQMKKGTS